MAQMPLLDVSLGCLRTATHRCKLYPGVQGTQVKYPSLPQATCVMLGKSFGISVCWCCPASIKSVREDLISEVLRTKIMIMRRRYQTEMGCINTVGSFEDIYFFKGCAQCTFYSCFKVAGGFQDTV